MRLVLDTNILVSAFVFKSANARNTLQLAAKDHVVLFSLATFRELSKTLINPKFSGIISPETVKNFIINLKKTGIFVAPSETISVCRDPKDNKFLELAVAGNATCIITGDTDLLVLNPFRKISIITPKEFLDQF
jgi:putative PIN family toxin of toxin-antitoxin system